MVAEGIDVRGPVLRRDRPGPPVEGRLDRAIAVGAQDPRPDGLEALERIPGRVAVRVVSPDGHDGDRRSHGGDEGRARRGPAAVMGDLEDVHPGQPALDECRVDVVLGVAGQQEAARTGRAEQHDRCAVDVAAVLGRLRWHGAAVGPQDVEADRVEEQPIAGGEPA